MFQNASLFKCLLLTVCLSFAVCKCVQECKCVQLSIVNSVNMCSCVFRVCVLPFSLSVFKCVVVMFVVWHGLVCSSDQVIKLARGGVSVIIEVLLLSL